MNIDRNKPREPLGQALILLDGLELMRIRRRVLRTGATKSVWRRILTTAKAYTLPTHVRDVLVEELPETAELFNHPKSESA